MKYVANKAFLSDELGRVEIGQEFTATDAQVHAVLAFVEPVGKHPAPKEDAHAAKSKGKHK